jgi:hypothetical protein
MPARLRCHVDDASPALALHQRNRRARNQECPGQIDGERALPIRLRRLFHAHAAARDPGGDAGIVHRHVEAAESAPDLLEHLRDLGSARNVSGQRMRPFTGFAK